MYLDSSEDRICLSVLLFFTSESGRNLENLYPGLFIDCIFRIKTNTTGAEFLYLPLEVEVSAQPGLYCPQVISSYIFKSFIHHFHTYFHTFFAAQARICIQS